MSGINPGSAPLVVEDVLTSTSTANALSAARGKALKDTADALATTVAAKADLVGGKVPVAQIPDIAVVDYLGAVANQTAMLALVGQKGDWCTRTDTGTTWIITGATPTLLASWTQLSYPAAAVQSVAGRTGVVVLAAADINDSTAVGRAMMTAADAAAQRTALGLGAAATAAVANVLTSTSTTDALSAAQGKALKDTADTLATTVAAKADLVSGKVPVAQIPDIAVVDYLGAVANQTAMLALVGQKGDWCTRTDTGTTWIITGATPTLLASWTQLSYPAAAVQSVAGRSGTVVLTAADVSDSTAAGRAMMTAADAAAQRTALGLAAAAPASTAWSTTWGMTANLDMGQFTVTGPLAITSTATGAVVGGTTCAVLVSNGVDVPTVDGMTVSPYASGSGEKTLLCLMRVGGQSMWFSSVPISVAAVTGPTNLRLATRLEITESGDATAGWSYALAPTGTWTARGSSHSLGATGDFIFLATIVGTAGDIMVGCGSNATGPGTYPDAGTYTIFASTAGGAYSVIENGSVGTIDTAINRASGDVIRVQRVGSTLTFAVARSATPTTFTVVNTVTGITAKQYAFISSATAATINTTKGQGFA